MLFFYFSGRVGSRVIFIDPFPAVQQTALPNKVTHYSNTISMQHWPYVYRAIYPLLGLCTEVPLFSSSDNQKQLMLIM